MLFSWRSTNDAVQSKKSPQSVYPVSQSGVTRSQSKVQATLKTKNYCWVNKLTTFLSRRVFIHTCPMRHNRESLPDDIIKTVSCRIVSLWLDCHYCQGRILGGRVPPLKSARRGKNVKYIISWIKNKKNINTCVYKLWLFSSSEHALKVTYDNVRANKIFLPVFSCAPP